jgi:hypothetical protein
MKKHARCLLASALLSSVSCGISFAASAETATAPAAEPRLDITTALEAAGPNPSLGDQAKVLNRLVGTWDVEYTDFMKDGTTLHRTGEFMVGWIMDGRALQDLWIVDPWGKHKDREVYMDVHYFDAKSRTWHAAFVDPQDGSVARFTASEVGNDRFVLETKEIDSGQTRWSFNDIRPDSFIWRDEGSSDGGKTWKLRSEYHMKRRGAGSPEQKAVTGLQ